MNVLVIGDSCKDVSGAGDTFIAGLGGNLVW
jgi:sugar/nucleoside kinase (ribokinase family)